ncbi:MAG: glycosyltransferase family 2 protein [Bacteroidota bacterium]
MRLSIITINYNNKSGLQKTIESVVAQTYKDFEYIVIDGGSNDGSFNVIKDYEKKISYWVSEKDSGIYNAMNKGIVQAKGKFCLFLNSGDWLVDRDILDRVFSLKSEEDIVYGNILKVYSATKIECDKAPQRSVLTLADMFFSTLNHPSTFIKRRLFDEYGLYNEEYQIVSDWAFFLKVIGVYNVSVKYIDVDISCYDMTGVSSSNGKLVRQERETELKKTLPGRVYKDYQQMAEYRWKARTYDKIVSQKPLWYLMSIYNKLFGYILWK